jgi:hypothetical protein
VSAECLKVGNYENTFRKYDGDGKEKSREGVGVTGIKNVQTPLGLF